MEFPPVRAFLTGIVCAVPLFVKQNTGLAFLVAVALAVVILLARAAWQRQRVSGYAWLLAGMAAALAAAILLLQFTVGMRNYWHWTIQFAAVAPIAQRFRHVRALPQSVAAVVVCRVCGRRALAPAQP